MKDKKLLITGGAGFIGSNFIIYLLQKYPEITVVNFDKLTYCGNLDNLREVESRKNYSFIKGDICDSEAVLRVMRGVDGVIHFAAESHVDNSIKDPYIFSKTNFLGTHVLLEAAMKLSIKRFLHISTDEVYGSILSGSFKETDKLNPSSPYSASKAGAELLVHGFHTTFKLPVLITRCSNTFGPKQYPEKVIPLFVTNLIQGKKVPLYGDGLHRRSWIHVLDVCSAIDFIFQKGVLGEIYNIPGTVELPNVELTRRILAFMKKDENFIEHVKDRLGHDRRYSVDGSKLAKLGWKSYLDFEHSLRETVLWYCKNEWWWKSLLARK